MTKRSIAMYGGFLAAVGFLAFAVYTRMRPEEAGSSVPGAASLPSPAVQPSTRADGGIEPIQEQRMTPTPERIEITDADRTPFLASPVAAKWKAEFGYTDEDLVLAQRKLRAARSTDINEPGAIMRALPPRHIASISISSLRVPSEAEAGKPIPFTLSGTAPSPSFTFTRFDINAQGEIIRIRAVGHAEGETESGPGKSLALEGEIDPLPAGNYRVEVPELGPNGTFPITVR
jgi:hypothetical protein